MPHRPGPRRILHVVGARPNFMKIAPIMAEMARHPRDFEQRLVHTGQHYDEAMSKVFFQELDLPQPDINLEVGSGSHAWQTARVMQRFEPVLQDYRPDWVLVPGMDQGKISNPAQCAGRTMWK
jgi:UDP-N-acetylglucosamine 2-epimerase (non-hydrolysing)